MLSFVCRLFAPLLVSLALSLPAYAMATLRVLAWQTAQSWPDRMEGSQRRGGARITSSLAICRKGFLYNEIF
jgi:hypothetical protein